MKKENSMKWIFAMLLLAGLIAGLGIAGHYLEGRKQSNEGTATLIIDVLGNQKTERFKFTQGTPLGILKYNHTVKTVLGDNFVECVDDICADGNYMWLFYANNKSMNYGVKSYKLNDGDVIKFEFTNQKTGEKT